MRSFAALMGSILGSHVAQLMRFAASGGVAAVVGLVTLYVSTDVFGLWYLASSTIAFLATFVVVFTLQKFWTFRETDLSRLPAQGAQSVALAGMNFVLNGSAMFVLVDKLHFHYLLAQCVVYGMFAVMNFLVYKFVIFKAVS